MAKLEENKHVKIIVIVSPMIALPLYSLIINIFIIENINDLS